jgi:membrane-bound inhibitor of C-type lysozyme
MRTRTSIALCAFFVMAFAGGCAGVKTVGLTVRGGEPITYQCQNGEKIVARYYSLSDDSLNFVKVTMPGGKVYTLPNVLSASGARYTNEIEMVWWNKGRTAFVQERDKNGDWQITYDNCKEIGEK